MVRNRLPERVVNTFLSFTFFGRVWRNFKFKFEKFTIAAFFQQFPIEFGMTRTASVSTIFDFIHFFSPDKNFLWN